MDEGSRRPTIREGISWTALLSLFLAGASTGIMPAEAVSQNSESAVRVIYLQPVKGAPYLEEEVRATVTLWEAGEPGSESGLSSRVNLKGLHMQDGWGAYGLYYTTKAGPADYVHGERGSFRQTLFNTDYDCKYEDWKHIGDRGIDTDTPIITVFIVFDPDDGRPFDPALDMERVALTGTSMR